MDEHEKKAEKLRRRIAALEKTIQIITGHSGRLEKQLRNLFDTVCQSLPVPVLIVDKSGEILFSNEKARKVFGYSKEEFGRINATQLYQDKKQREDFLKKFEEGQEIASATLDMKRADGSVLPASLCSREIEYEGRKSIFSVLHDLSRIRREEEKRLELEKQLRQTRKMEAIGAMATGVAHDFNNILSAIFGNLQLAALLLSDPQKAGNHIERALDAAERARKITAQILTFTRNKGEERKPFDIGAAVAEAMSILRSMIGANIELNLAVEKEKSAAMGDPANVHQVVMNLVSNAAYVLRETGGTIDVRLERVDFDQPVLIGSCGLEPGAYMMLCVADNGPGIEESELERVFDPFFTTKPVGEGTGMGLSLVHGIMRGFGGATNAQSAPGRGSSFFCYFPRFSGELAEEEKDVIGDTPVSGDGRILFVDDETAILETYSQVMRNWGYDVTASDDPVKALDLFSQNPRRFDLIVSDQTMPRMTGEELARKARQIRPGMPVLIVTGGGQNLSESSVSSVLQKPFSFSEMAAAIKEALCPSSALDPKQR